MYRARGNETARQLSRFRKYAVLVCAIVAAVVTPTPDPVNMMIVMVPLYILFEFGVILAREVVARIDRLHPLEPVSPNYSGEVAQRWRYKDGAGEIGVISSVTNAFCGTCNRARISTDGTLYTCLFAAHGTDLRSPLRAGATVAELQDIIRDWMAAEAENAARAGASARFRLASANALWDKASALVADADIYNLDRRQTLVSVFDLIRDHARKFAHAA